MTRVQMRVHGLRIKECGVGKPAWPTSDLGKSL